MFKKATYDKDIANIKRYLRDLVKSQATCKTTQGGDVKASINNSSTNTGALAEADGIRIVEVLSSGAAGELTIQVDLHDGSTFTHRVFSPADYRLELESYQSPISLVTVTEIDSVATEVFINYLSK